MKQSSIRVLVFVLLLLLIQPVIYAGTSEYGSGWDAIVIDNIATSPEADRSKTRGGEARADMDVVINEIMLLPDEGGKWIELYNGGSEPVNMNHWMISDEDGLSYEFANMPIFPSGAYIVLHFESGENEFEFGQTQPNTLHLYTGWMNVRWIRHSVYNFHYYARSAVGYDLVTGGKPEIVVNTFGENEFRFYESKADITRTWNRSVIDEAGTTNRIKLIDINIDPFTDIVYNDYFGNDDGNDSLFWIKGPVTNVKDPWGGPYPVDKVPRPEGLDAGNISGDNRTDIVVGSESQDDIFWYECPGDPTIESWTKYTIDTDFDRPGALKLFDIDADSDKDLVATGSFGEEVVWYEHPADPTQAWTKHKISSGTRSSGTGSNDRSGDNSGSSRNSARSKFEPTGELVVDDFNHDSFIDIVVSEPRQDRIIWYQSPPDPKDPNLKWLERIIDDNITDPSGLDYGDFDSDFDVDLTVAAADGNIYWYSQPPPGPKLLHNWPKFVVDSDVHLPFYVNATDLDNDGDLDLMTADQADGKVIWYENVHLELNMVDQCTLYHSTNAVPETVIDFVAWGGPAGGEDKNAVLAGQWGVNTFVSMIGAGSNQTLARDRLSTDRDTVSDWDISSGIDSAIHTEGLRNCPEPENKLLRLDYNPALFLGAVRGGNGPPPSVMAPGLCLANFSAYTFVVKVENPFGWDDLDRIELMLRPDSNGPVLIWTMATNNFSITGGIDYVSLVEKYSTAAGDGIYTWTLNFTVIFHWSYPPSGLEPVKLSSFNKHGYFDMDVHDQFYRVETGLKLVGELNIRSAADGRTLGTNDWVIPDQMLNVNGPVVMYDESSFDYYPSDSEFDVLLKDDLGSVLFDHTSAGYPVNFTLSVHSNAKTGFYNINTALVNLKPGATGSGTPSKQLSVDAGGILFDKPSPESSVWHTRNRMVSSIRLSDLKPESGINGNSIEYRTANVSHDHLGEWQGIPLSGSGEIMEPAVSVNYKEGPDNWIQWRASDVAGNGPSVSSIYRVSVDTVGIGFQDFFPPDEFVQADTRVPISITITDFHGSGVDTGTIRAAVKPNGASDYGDWFDPGFTVVSKGPPSTDELISGPEIVVLNTTVASFTNGTYNLIKFRGLDIAGNGFSESEEFRIRIDTSRSSLRVFLVEPVNGSIIRTAYPQLKWQPELSNQFSNLYYRLYLDTERSRLEALDNSGSYTNITPLKVITGTQMELDFEFEGFEALEPEITYYWTVVPFWISEGGSETPGICASGIFEFSIFTSEAGLELSAEPDSIQVYAGNHDAFKLKLRNLGRAADNFTLTVQPAGGLSLKLSSTSVFLRPGEVEYLNLTVSAKDNHEGGNQKITLDASGLSFNTRKSIELDIRVISDQEKKTDAVEKIKGTASSRGIIVLVFVIMVVLLLLTAWHWLRSSRAYKEDDGGEKKADFGKLVQLEIKDRPVAIIPGSQAKEEKNGDISRDEIG